MSKLILIRAVVLCVLAASMVATAFTHRFASPEEEAARVILAVMGGADDVCGSEQDTAAFCEVCRLIDAAHDAPGAKALRDLDFECSTMPYRGAARTIAIGTFDHSHAERAPPA